MKNTISFFATGIIFLLVSCSSGQDNAGEHADSAKIPDSVPQTVMIGKGGNYAYKPDTAMNQLVLGDAAIMKKFMYDNGAEGEVAGSKKVIYYFNGLETEFLSVYVTIVDGKNYPYRFRLQKNSDTIGNYKKPHGYVTDRNFLSGHGIYIGMPPDFVQSVYKSQPMLRWVKGDTTYLKYSPSEKDKTYFTHYQYSDYSATYKFVDDKCREIEMIVKPEVFESK